MWYTVNGKDLGDTIGNPTSYYNGTRWTFTWKNGRELAKAVSGDLEVTYTYDANGIRHTKTVDNAGTEVVYTYYYAGGRLMRLTIGSDVTMDFFYDQNGQPFAMKYNGTLIYYVLNQQGDVVRLVNSSGASYGIYEYDAWGNITYTTNTPQLNNNPLRYRGYVYDSETGLYYCQSRYYDPAIGRFINADALASTGQGLLGNNMFAYCQNSPICFVDSSGNMMVGIIHSYEGCALSDSLSSLGANHQTSIRGEKRTKIPTNYALITETTEVKAGTKIAQAFSVDLSGYSLDKSGLNLGSFDFSVVTLDILMDNFELGLFDLLNVNLSAGVKGLPYASAMVSIWSPSFSVELFNLDVTIVLHVGAYGFEFDIDKGKVGAAKGLGISISVS